MPKKIKEKIELSENEDFKNEIKSIIQESLITDESMLDDTKKLQDIDTVKVIINEILAVKKHLPSTTNLTKKQVHGITKLKTLNKIYKSPLIDEYIFNIEELKRSETDTPFNMLKGFFDLANNVKNVDLEQHGMFDRILGRKGKV